MLHIRGTYFLKWMPAYKFQAFIIVYINLLKVIKMLYDKIEINETLNLTNRYIFFNFCWFGFIAYQPLKVI